MGPPLSRPLEASARKKGVQFCSLPWTSFSGRPPLQGRVLGVKASYTPKMRRHQLPVWKASALKGQHQ